MSHRVAVREPIAIVGVGCRFQDVDDVDQLWSLLRAGRCAMREIPPDRFDIDRYYDPTPGRRGRIVTREGGYLRNVWDFDNTLFGVSHREALAMDPQHRLLLEVGYQALLDAGIPSSSVAGRRVAVAVGMFTSDFRDRAFRHPDMDLDVYVEIGTTRSSAAGRLAHAFDLVGPATTVDAACASSLVSVQQACQALWLGTAELALAGGCNLVLEPEGTVCFSQSGMLSPDSRCKFGDASANGFVRSDGAALVVLKPLSAALRDGDRVYATIAAVGVSNDGRQGSGLFMTPSVEGQRMLLDHVWTSHKLDPAQLVYFEAHGTGTGVGDPVETKALTQALTGDRSDTLWIGSVKTNLGHTEGAAGIAGLLKAALALYHREIPPSLHVTNPNPAIPWADGPLAIPQEPIPLSKEGGLAGVSAFGLSGTNAHAVLASPPAPPERAAEAGQELWILPVSGHTPEALRARARGLQAVVAESTPEQLQDICFTMAQRTTPLAYRSVALGHSRETLLEELAAIGSMAEPAPAGQGGPVFVFGGQGGQWPRMARALSAQSPTFRAALADVDEVFRAVVDWSPQELLDDREHRWVYRIDRVQPLIVCVQVAMAEMWRALGVEPVAVVGHSLGEVSAAVVSGALSVEDGVRVICGRSELLAGIAGTGAMAVIAAPPSAVEPVLAEVDHRAVVAVVNGAQSTVVSGDPDAVDHVVDHYDARDVFARRVRVDVASHSPHVEPLAARLRQTLGNLKPVASRVPMMSTVDADWIEGPALHSGYWARNLRQAVQFHATTQGLIRAGHRRFVECGPHPVLTGAITATLQASGGPDDGVVVATAHRDDVGDETRCRSLQTLVEAGVPVDVSRVQPRGRVVTLPPFPFQRDTFELPAEPDEDGLVPMLGRTSGDGHPWLARPLRLAFEPSVQIWQVPLSVRSTPWLGDHKVRGTALLPGAAFVEIAMATGTVALEREVTVHDVELLDTFAVPMTAPQLLQVQLRTLPDGAQVAFHSFDEGGALRLHATARLEASDVEDAGPREEPRALLRERLQLEHARARRNSGHVYGLLEADLAGNPETNQSQLPVHRIRRSLRGSDVVFALAQDRVLVVASVAQADQLQVVAQRLLGVLQGVGEAGGWLGELRLRGCAVMPNDAPVEQVMEHIETGLPVLGVELEPGGAETLPGVQLYDSMVARGIQYGPACRPVREVLHGGGVATATLVLPEVVMDEIGRQPTHAAFLDGCFQAAVASFLTECDERDGFLPVGLQRLRTFNPPTAQVTCHAWHRGRPRGRDDELLVDFIVLDESDRPVLAADGLRVRRFSHRVDEPLERRIERWMYRWAWSPVEALSDHADPRPWLVVGPGGPLVEALGATAVEHADDVGHALETLPPGPCGVVVVAAADADPATSSMQVLRALRAISDRASDEPARLWVVTRRAWPVEPDEACNPDQAGLWGLVRVLANEASEVSPRIVDTDALDAPALAQVILDPGALDEAAVRGASIWQHTLLQGRPAAQAAAFRTVEADEPAVMVLDPRDRALSIRRSTAPSIAADELLVHVEAVTWSQVAPGAGLVGLTGRVRSAGSAVTRQGVGDRVVALLPGAGRAQEEKQVAREVVVPADRVVRVEDSFDPLLACDLAAHWLPALAALRGLCAGERLFVAAAEAPVAQAAAWLANQRGATVVAAADRLATRSALRACGIDFVVDPGAADLPQVSIDLAGGPFDRVLDLGGALPRVALEPLLAVGGEVVMGDRASAVAGLEAVVHEVVSAVHGDPGRQVAALRTLIFGPHRLPELWGRVDPLDPREAPVSAWTSWALDLRRVSLLAQDADDAPLRFDPRGTYIVTGGTGGLGLRLAAWLGRRGAGKLVLISRSARVRAEDALAYDAVMASGAEIHVESADVSDAAAVEAVVQRATALGPLRGVFHLAGLLRDGTWQQLDEARFEAVLGPKAWGAWNLHRATVDLPLEHFVMFGSAAATVGSPGQGNYAAANTVLDSLAHHRRALGLPGLSIAWGAWSETGLAAAQKNRGERLQQKGMASMVPADALEAMAEVLRSAEPEVAVLDIDWSRWAKSMPAVRKKPSLSALVPSDVEPVWDEAPALERVPAEDRLAQVTSQVRGLVAEITRLPRARIDDRTSLAALGLDSLMAVELRAGLHERFGVELSPRRLLGMPNLGALGALVLDAWENRHGAPSTHRVMGNASLPTTIQAHGPRVRAGERHAVLLTGATGFVGVHVLRELLDHTDHTVVCLVRGDNVGAAEHRLGQQLQHHGLDREGDEARIEVVRGDLSSPRLGLSPTSFQELGERVGSVYHCGAWVNHVYDYATLAPTNVDGTAEVLRFAVTGGIKPVHHVSTMVVFPFTTRLAEAFEITEDTPLEPTCEPFFAGYAESKWAAERLCFEAMERGIPVSVYRLGQVSGSHDAAWCPSSDAVWRIVHGIAKMGQVPGFSAGLAMTPVDYVSKAMVHLSRQADAAGRRFHLSGTEGVRADDLANALHRVGIDVVEVDKHAWRAELVEEVERAWPIAPILPRLEGLDLEALDQAQIRVPCADTLRRLPDEIAQLRHIDSALLTAYLERLVKEGFLPVPHDITTTPMLALDARRAAAPRSI